MYASPLASSYQFVTQRFVAVAEPERDREHTALERSQPPG